MKETVELIFERLFINYPDLKVCREDIKNSFYLIYQCYQREGKILLCGNGGSASDCEHIVGELMKGFILKRPLKTEEKRGIKELFPVEGQYLADYLQGALPAISLVSHTSITSAFINDVQPDMVFAQQVYGYGKLGDVLIGLSTSGNSSNVINAMKIAKFMNIKTIGITGETGGKMREISDIYISVPVRDTYRVQEYHLPIYHTLCEMIEEEFFGEHSCNENCEL